MLMEDKAFSGLADGQTCGRAGVGAPSSGGDGNDNETEIASTSEGESSGGREISEIIKNSAIARRRKLADGQFKANVKNNFSQPQLPPPPPPPPPLLLPPLPNSTAQFWPYNKQFMFYRQKQQYRHVEAPKAKAFIENNL
ncbi:hypothetical protein GQX74_004508 [Glossina fuscipes]|nr:hypothetical protein GQX74_004508 [Glossina fuscipes]